MFYITIIITLFIAIVAGIFATVQVDKQCYDE